MEETQYRTSPENGIQKMTVQERRRMSIFENDDEDLVECSGKNCRSCTGSAIADCVALCCCPCAVMSILALAFVKLPLMVARKCLRLKNKKKKKRKAEKMLEEKQKCRRSIESCKGKCVNLENDENLRRVKVDQDQSLYDGEEDERYGGSTRFQMEKIWLELYDQVGHFGFGRVSFTGVPVST